MSGKKSKEKPAKPEAEAEAVAADGEEGAPAKKKLAGKTLILFIVLPAVLVLGGGGAAAMMLLGGKAPAAEAHAEAGHEGEAEAKDKPKKDAKKDKAHAEGKGEHAAAAGDPADVGTLTVGEDGQPSYYDMPTMLVNLSGEGEGDRPLLLELELVLESQDAHAFDDVPARMPRLMDQVQTFLRELRVEDLNGSAGTYRLRLELLKRFNLVLAPAKVEAVLIEGILIQ